MKQCIHCQKLECPIISKYLVLFVHELSASQRKSAVLLKSYAFILGFTH